MGKKSGGWLTLLKDHTKLHRSQKSKDWNMASSSVTSTNIIQNHDFSNGLHSWYTNSCDGVVVEKQSTRYAVIANRKETWQGLEQDITTRISPGLTYTLIAHVGVSAEHPHLHLHLHGHADVIATLKLEYHGSETKYMQITRTSVSKERWEKLEGTFVLPEKPDRVVLYLEGPAPGVNILIKSLVVTCATSHGIVEGCNVVEDENIILNPNFEDGVNNWSGRGCTIARHDSMGKIVPKFGKFFASTTQRTQNWNGIQQDISGRVKRKLAYSVIATVRIFGNNVTSADVRATLWVQTPDSREQYIGIATAQATDKEWMQLEGKFLLNGSASKVVVYLEGPPPGVDILLNGMVVKHAEKIPPSPPPYIENVDYGVNIITNSDLREGTNGWFPLGNCALGVTTGSPHVLPPTARDTLGPHEPLSGHGIHATNRTQTWMGPAQMITDKIKLFVTYQVSAWVRLGHGSSGSHNVNVALGVDNQWVNGGQVEVNDDRWHEISGSFRIEKEFGKIMVYVQGPAPGISFMLAGFQIFPVDRKARFKQLKQQTDKIRKQDVTLKFSNLDESNMQGKMVIIKQIQNSFPIGSCISRSNIDNEDFVSFFLKHFNWAVFGNELKWYWTESQQGNFNYRDADDLLEFCNRNNIPVRGHCIFWEVEDTVQNWVKNLSKSDLAIAVNNRLTGLLNRYKGKFKHYDVNNEMLHGSFYRDRLGNEIRPNMFKIANKLDPSSVLFVNDYHVEDGCDTRSSPEKYIDQIFDLQEHGAPVGGIGVQGHIDSPVGSIVGSNLDKLGLTGLPIWFTELDVSSVNEHVRADDLEVMMWEAFGNPGVEGIVFWGFWELFMSRENSHLVNAEGEVNEAGKRFIEVKKEWLSHAHGFIDEENEFRFRYKRNMWSHIIFEHPSTFDTLAMDPKKKKEILDDLMMFSKSKDYYKKVGKSWKRGYLLYGPPGTGKSSMIAAMANLLEYDIYDLELTSVKDNTDLRKLLIETSSKSIIVIEDIDCSLDLTGQRKEKKEESKEEEKDPVKKAEEEKSKKNKGSEVTLSGLLNFIDGLWSACGSERLIVFTTNFVEKLDPALIRRGRMDKHIELSYCCFETFKVLAKNYLDLESHDLFSTISRLLKETKMTPADVAENLMPKSFEENAESCLNKLIQSLENAKEEARLKAVEDARIKAEEEAAKKIEQNGDKVQESTDAKLGDEEGKKTDKHTDVKENGVITA